MTTNDEQKTRVWNEAMSIKDKIAFAFDTKYLSFFFQANGRLDEGVAICLAGALVLLMYVYLTQEILILLPVWYILCILVFRVEWKPLILKVLGWIPSKK